MIKYIFVSIKVIKLVLIKNSTVPDFFKTSLYNSERIFIEAFHMSVSHVYFPNFRCLGLHVLLDETKPSRNLAAWNEITYALVSTEMVSLKT